MYSVCAHSSFPVSTLLISVRVVSNLTPMPAIIDLCADALSKRVVSNLTPMPAIVDLCADALSACNRN